MLSSYDTRLSTQPTLRGQTGREAKPPRVGTPKHRQLLWDQEWKAQHKHRHNGPWKAVGWGRETEQRELQGVLWVVILVEGRIPLHVGPGTGPHNQRLTCCGQQHQAIPPFSTLQHHPQPDGTCICCG